MFLVASEEWSSSEDRDTIRQKTVQILQDLLKEEEAWMPKSARKSAVRKRKSSKEAKSGMCSNPQYYAEEMRRMASCTSRIPSHLPERSPKRSIVPRKWQQERPNGLPVSLGFGGAFRNSTQRSQRRATEIAEGLPGKRI